MKKVVWKIFIATALIALVFPVFGLAQERAKVDISIPCISCKNATGENPVGLIADFYELALALSGVLALGMIIYAGILRVTSANSPSKVSESNDIIFNALLGIVLLFGAYILLNTINPELTKLEIPQLSKIEVKEGATGTYSQYECTGATGVVVGSGNEGVRTESCHATQEECLASCSNKNSCVKVAFCAVSGTGACPIADFKPLTDPASISMENGTTVLWSSGISSVDANLTKLRAEFDKLKSALAAKGASVTVSSVYRPMEYQAHLYQIYVIHQKLFQLTPSQRADCSTVEANFEKESAKHGICHGSSPCLVSAPSQSSTHTNGTAMDISPVGISLSDMVSLISAKGIKLRWLGPQDKVHFTLTN